MSSSELERRIDQIVAAHVNPDGPGLALLVARGPEILVDKGYGLADAAAGTPITPATRFVIGSVTKQFACMGVMLLHKDGSLAYDDPVGKYLPELPATWRDRLTLRQLMHHTSGVAEYLTEEFWATGAEYPDVASIVRLIATLEQLEFEPGSRWRYCNSGYILLGEVVARAANQSFAAFMHERVFAPLGMRNTLIGESDDRLPNLAVGYDYTSREQFEPSPWNFSVIGGADGNVISDTHDLHLWTEAQQDCVLLPPQAAALALVPCKPLDPAFSRYGLGLSITERRGVREISHGGGTLGYVTHLASYPDERLTVVVLSNATGIKLSQIRGQIANLLLAETMRPLEPVELSAAVLQEKVGTYVGQLRDHRTTVTLSIEAGELVAAGRVTAAASADIERERYTLMPLTQDTFLADQDTDTYIQFIRDVDGLHGLRIQSSGSVINLDRAASDQ